MKRRKSRRSGQRVRRPRFFFHPLYCFNKILAPWLVAWHIRDDTYSKALAEIINYLHQVPFAARWGEGTTSSSHGQRCRVGGRGEATGQVNLKDGNDPGVTFYTHLSDQYEPYQIKAINAAARDATYVLDGLLYHESDLRIEEHYTFPPSGGT